MPPIRAAAIKRVSVNAVPGADLVAEGAADAAGQVDGADLKGQLVARAGNGADAVDGADDQAGLAAGAHVLVEQGQDFGELFLGHSCVILWQDAESLNRAAG